jgi:arylsulfatase A-like enzyme
VSRRKPNLLLICTDTQRCDTLGAYGSRTGATPRLDALAEKSIVMTEAYTASPVCGPARCSLLTGLYPPSHGAIENGFERHADLVTLPDLLKQQGYRCLMAGKTHFGPVPESFERYDEGPSIGEVGSYPKRDEAVVDEALRWLDELPGDEPWFLFLSLHMPHEPFQPTDEAVAAIDPATLPLLNWESGDLEREPPHLREDLGVPHFLDEHEKFFPNGEADRVAIDADRRRYHALCGMLDEQVGRVLDRVGDDAAIVFTSDHGTTLYDHGFKEKHCFYDPVWRVPMIIKPPHNVLPEHEAGLMTWPDLTATLLGWAGADTSEMQGFDLSLDLLDPTRDAKGWPRQAAVGTVFHASALVTWRWKLEYDHRRGIGRLFDRAADPSERHDLWDEAVHKRQKLLAALLTWHAGLHSPQLDTRHRGRGGPVADHARRVRDAVPANAADVLLQRMV